MATPKQFRRRGRWSLIIGTLVAALAIVGVTFATTFNLTGTYVSIAGTNLHQTPPIANTDLAPSCTAAELTAAGTGVLWHFVLTQTTDPKTGSLLADFQTAGLTDPAVHFDKDTGSVLMWDIITPTFDTLLNASTDALGGLLNLSHVCYVPTTSTPEIATTASVATGGTGVAGDTFQDKATLTGFTNPAGTITFRVYNLDTNPTCSGTGLYSEDVAVTTPPGNGDYSTVTGFKIPSAGTYTWTATYVPGGSDTTNGTVGPTGCGDDSETLAFDASVPDVETAIHLGTYAAEVTAGKTTLVTGPVDLGSSVHDSATVTGPAALTAPTGHVTFAFYSGSTDPDHPCSSDSGATSVAAGDITLVADGTVAGQANAHPSSNEGPLGAGTYGFIASFHSGDTNVWQDGVGTCESLTVNKGTLSIVTHIHNAAHSTVGGTTHVALGSVVHDTAHVTGQVAGFNPDLTKVQFAFFTSIDCTDGGSVVANTGADEVTSPDLRSAASSALAAGSYSYRARFAGDANYNPLPGTSVACEPLTVDKGNLTLTTYIHDSLHNVVTSVPVNGTVHDTAHFGGAVSGFTPTAGNVSFTFYNTIDCTGTGVSKTNTGADEKTTPDPRTVDVGPLGSGAYSFNASFSGDTNYNPVLVANVACEPLHVRTFGYTMGFWGNRNGQALLATNHAFSTNVVTLGIGTTGVTTTCWVPVDSATKSLTIFPNTLNGISILNNCMTSTKLDSGINTASLNVLLAQTLALSYNNLYKSGFAGQTIGAMGCTAFSPLTSSSTTQDVQTYANYLIANAIKGAPTVTQTQIGVMNTLLGCMNTEAA